MLQGHCTAMTEYTGTAHVVDDPTASKVVGKIDFAATPKQVKSGPAIGTFICGIASGAPNPAGAVKFLEWFTSSKVQKEFAGDAAARPSPAPPCVTRRCRRSTAGCRRSPTRSTTPSPKPRTPDEPKMEDLLGTALNQALVQAIAAEVRLPADRAEAPDDGGQPDHRLSEAAGNLFAGEPMPVRGGTQGSPTSPLLNGGGAMGRRSGENAVSPEPRTPNWQSHWMPIGLAWRQRALGRRGGVAQKQPRVRAGRGSGSSPARTCCSLPAAIALAGVSVYPLFYGVRASFTHYLYGRDLGFDGLTNYRNVWNDTFFRQAMLTTAKYVVICRHHRDRARPGPGAARLA